MLIKFWWHWPYFQVHSHTLNCPKSGFGALSSGPVAEFGSNLHRYIVRRRGRFLIKFWWHWPYFQGQSGTLKCPKYGFCALSSETADGFWPNLHRYIVGKRGRVDQILVTLTVFSRSHWYSEMPKIGFPYAIHLCTLREFDPTCIDTSS